MSKQGKQQKTKEGVQKKIRKARVSMYQVLKDDLVESIRSGKLRPGDRVPSESQLIAKYHVSSTTARRCLDELESEGMLERQRGKGTFVSGLASVLKRARVALIVNSLSSFTHPFTATVAATLEKCLDEAGVNIVVIRARDASGKIRTGLVDMLEYEGCRHALLLSSVPLPTVQTLVEKGISCIGVNIRYMDPRIPNISIALAEGIRMRYMELARLGHKHMVTLIHERPLREEGILNSSSVIPEIYEQVRREIPQLPEKPEVRLVTDVAELPRHIGELMKESANVPTAFLCWDEICAIEVHRCLVEMGYKVPEQVSVVGSKLLANSSVACIEIPIAEMAAYAADAVVNWMREGKVPENVDYYPSALLPRETIGKAPHE